MKNFVEELRKYYANTSEEQIAKDWASTEEFDKIGIPASDFLNHTYNCMAKIKYPDKELLNYIEPQHTDPEISSGFFYK